MHPQIKVRRGSSLLFPQAELYDTFTGANGTVLETYDASKWADMAVALSSEIQGNAAASSTAETIVGMTASVANFGPDLDITFDIVIVSASPGSDAGFFIRGQDAGSSATLDGFLITAKTQTGIDNLRIYRIDNGTFTNILSVNQEFAARDSVGCRARGSSLQLYYKPAAGSWSKVGPPVFSTSYNAIGKIGTYIESEWRLDNLRISTL